VLLRLFALWTTLALRRLGARRFRREIGAVSLATYRVGPPDGEPWLLLHGLGSTALSWSALLPPLSAECRLLVPELSELGGTGAPGGALAVQEGVATLARLIAAEFPGRRVTIAGLSLGGWMAVRLALARPDLVARLVLIDAGGYRDQDWNEIERLVRIESLEGVDRLYGALFVRAPWPFRWSRRGFLAAYTSRAVTSVLGALAAADTFDERDLARLACPTALVWGERDGLFAARVGQAMAAAVPSSRFYLLPGCGHAVHWECPRAMVEAVLDFRRRHPVTPFRPRRARPEPAAPPEVAHGDARVSGLPGL
jgi:pimeloyl-ACP methyl ester carboxylesterase